MTCIKICGLTREEDIQIVNLELPEYIGFVFTPSKREITEETARRLKDKLDPRIQSVGVFVNAPIQRIVDLCKDGIIDCVQLHGGESFEYVKELREQISRPIIYAQRVKDGMILGESQKDLVDFQLYDTYDPHRYGGSGILIDYMQLGKLPDKCFLAGGLSAENIREVIDQVHPYCVDVSSSVEIDGKKDARKIHEFIWKVRHC